jgi:RNA polymerase sigma-70 factor (ECF subfamily)
MAEQALEVVVFPSRRSARVAEIEFEKLVKQYQGKIVRLAVGMLRDPDLAEDVAQETFVRAFRFYESFRNDSAFFTWLYRIAVNLCLDAHRKARIRPTEPIEAGDEGSEPEDPAPGPERMTEMRELAKHVDVALDALSANHKVILILREVEGLSYEELSRVLRIPKGTVMSRLFHARMKLQRECARLAGLETMPLLIAAAVLLQLTTSGGITGKGNGRSTIYKDYAAVYETPDGRTCRQKMTADEKTRLHTVIGHSRPESWRANRISAGPDEVVFTLVYRGGRKPRTVRWTDRASEGLPVSVTILIHELDELRDSALGACGLRGPDATHSGEPR